MFCRDARPPVRSVSMHRNIIKKALLLLLSLLLIIVDITGRFAASSRSAPPASRCPGSWNGPCLFPWCWFFFHQAAQTAQLYRHEISFWQFKLSHASHWNCTRQSVRVDFSLYAFKISALFTTAVQDLSDTRPFLTSGCPLVAFRECCTHFTSSALSWHSVTLF